MSIFGSIVSAIFGSSAQAKAAAPSGSAAAPAGAQASSASTSSAPTASAAASAPSAGASSAAAPISKAEVEALIAGIAAKRGGKYNWQQSIVDLMKLLDLDSADSAREKSLHKSSGEGALDGSAEMNVWLAQAGNGTACGKRRQGAGEPQGLTCMVDGRGTAATVRPLRFRNLALQPDDLPIEAAEKRRSVFRRERLRAAGDLAGRAQLIHQVAGRERHADGVLAERLAVRRDRDRAGLHGARSERQSAVITMTPLAPLGDEIVALSMPEATTIRRSAGHAERRSDCC